MMSYLARHFPRHKAVSVTVAPPHIRLYSATAPTQLTMSAASANPDVQRVLTFWFDRNPIEWIIAPAGLDDQLKSEFGDLVHKARSHALDDWATASPESSVALVARGLCG